MSVIFDYKIFDENKSNLLSASDYSSHSQRINGFQTNQEIISSIFNSVIYQNSIVSYAFTRYIADTNSVNFRFSDSNTTIINNIKNFFDNFNAKSSNKTKDLDITTYTYGSILTVGENGLDEIHGTTNKSIVFGESGLFNAREIVKFNKTETIIDNVRYFACNTNISYTNLQKYELVLYIINTNSGNKTINKFEFDLSDLPALSFTISEDRMQIYDDGFRLKEFYNRCDGTQRWFYLGLATNYDSSNPTKGPYIVVANDLTDQGLDGCRYKLQVKEKM